MTPKVSLSAQAAAAELLARLASAAASSYRDLALKLGSDCDLGLALDVALKLGAALDPGLIRARDIVLDVAGDRDLELALDLTRAFELAADLISDLDRDLISDLDRDLPRDRFLARELATRLNGVAAAAGARIAELGRDAGPDSLPHHGVPARRAVRLITVAVRLLPPTYRPRYQEEFRAELQVLAEDGCPRRAQLRYACALAVRVALLRRGLSTLHPAKKPEESR